MKRALILFALVLASLGAVPAHAQVFAQLGGATPVPMNARLAGVFLHLSENSSGALGQLRLSFHPGVDFGFQGGVSRVDVDGPSRTGIRMGADFRVQVAAASTDMPFDLSLGAGIGIETADEFTLLAVGPSVLGSRRLEFGGQPLTPYGGIAALFSRLDVGDLNQTDLGIAIRLGADYEIQQSLHVLLELQPRFSDDFNDNFSFSVGVQTSF
jgi:hypothetical protein